MNKVYIGLLGGCMLLSNGCDVQSQAQQGAIQEHPPANANPSTTEMAMGIKEVLEQGTEDGADKLAAKDGFLGNKDVRIDFPEEAQNVEDTLRNMGLGSFADNVVTSLNRAAEDAAKQAKPIFTSAIQQMTLVDVVNILTGNPMAATTFFKRATTGKLMEKLKPYVTSSLNKVGATKYWNEAVSKYNSLSLVKSINPDLSNYVAQKAIEGMFIQIAQEELQIRNNKSARSTSLLKKVFGFADRNK
ncbi:DUF4197 domain-containing protein [Pedobacter sp.]|uniref:DUF4197 domain-containing protein n=1 Tax=Pedobacter sp. TaxID=1411316 RepID=UPI003D7F7365